jgi:hypothetical protein
MKEAGLLPNPWGPPGTEPPDGVPLINMAFEILKR